MARHLEGSQVFEDSQTPKHYRLQGMLPKREHRMACDGILPWVGVGHY